MTRPNAAADRLRHYLAGTQQTSTPTAILGTLDAALATERRHTVDRIRNALLLNEGAPIPEEYAALVLDEVAA